MKRHSSLAPLSREHHGALMLAQLMKKDAPAYKGLPETLGEKVNYAEDYYHNHLKPHFIKEEAMLQMVDLQLPAFTSLAAEIIAEHIKLATMLLSLKTEGNQLAASDEAARLLELHIRKEERVLFPLLEQHCSEETLTKVAAILE